MAKVCLLFPSAVLALLFFWNLFPDMGSQKLLSVDFEVFGRVQGVFFRKYTQNEATKQGLKGWCMNTHEGTVKGVVQGDSNKVSDMKSWLQNTGSPSSQIDKVNFSNEKEISKLSFDSFKVKR